MILKPCTAGRTIIRSGQPRSQRGKTHLRPMAFRLLPPRGTPLGCWAIELSLALPLRAYTRRGRAILRVAAEPSCLQRGGDLSKLFWSCPAKLKTAICLNKIFEKSKSDRAIRKSPFHAYIIKRSKASALILQLLPMRNPFSFPEFSSS